MTGPDVPYFACHPFDARRWLRLPFAQRSTTSPGYLVGPDEMIFTGRDVMLQDTRAQRREKWGGTALRCRTRTASIALPPSCCAVVSVIKVPSTLQTGMCSTLVLLEFFIPRRPCHHSVIAPQAIPRRSALVPCSPSTFVSFLKAPQPIPLNRHTPIGSPTQGPTIPTSRPSQHPTPSHGASVIRIHNGPCCY